jgi:hypothetical protein
VLLEQAHNTLAFGYDNQNDDADVAALLQSGDYTNKAALARKLRVSPSKVKSALQRVLDTEGVGTIQEYIASVANKEQKEQRKRKHDDGRGDGSSSGGSSSSGSSKAPRPRRHAFEDVVNNSSCLLSWW